MPSYGDATTKNSVKAKKIISNALAQQAAQQAAPKQSASLNKHGTKKTMAARDFRIVADEETGDLCISVDRYQFSKSIILNMDEMPDRYKAFFAKYILCK